MANSVVKSAARTVEILDHFHAVRVPQSQKQLCEALDYPQSSATSLLRTLTAKGYLNYDHDHRVYFPTVKLAAFGEWIPTALFGQGVILRVLRELHAATKETVVIAIRNDIDVQYIAAIESSHSVRFHVEVGDMRPVTRSVIGWLLMSHLDKKDAAILIRRSNIANGRGASANIDKILEQVNLTTSLGYGYGENIPILGGASLGILLPLQVHRQAVALCCEGALERMRLNRNSYLSAMQRVVASIENKNPHLNR
jgi:DNA-binding IclR family transcriptional regulator